MTSQQNVNTDTADTVIMSYFILCAFLCHPGIYSMYDLCNHTEYEKLFIYTNETFTYRLDGGFNLTFGKFSCYKNSL